MVVRQKAVMAMVVLGVAFLTTGCQSLFVSNQTTTLCRWKTWGDMTTAFDKIQPQKTTLGDLENLGFDPAVTPNIKIMPYIDIVPMFMPNPNIHLKDLPVGVQLYVESKQGNCAYLVEIENVHEKRHGNIFLDVFSFKRQTHQSGWRFRGLILIKDDKVVYTLSSGEPDISTENCKVRPLGPFQELDGCAGSIIGLAK